MPCACPPPDERVDTTFPVGERRRVALCKLLMLSNPTCVLDEPPTTSTRERAVGSEQHFFWGGDRLRGCDSSGHPRPLLLDNVAEWIPGADRVAAYPTRAILLHTWRREEG